MHYSFLVFWHRISYIVHDLGALRVAQEIRIMGSSQVNDFVQDWFMNLNNSFDVIMCYLLIWGITILGPQDEGFHGEFTCVIGYTLVWTYSESGNWLSSNHDPTKLVYCMSSQLERILSLY